MVKNIIDGNYFGGQLLVKIEREITNNPYAIKSTKLLFVKSDKDGKKTQTEALFMDLEKTKQQQGKHMTNFEMQPPVEKKSFEL